MGRYRKLYAAGVAAGVATIGIIVNGVTKADAVTLFSVWSGVLGVFLFPNDPPAED